MRWRPCLVRAAVLAAVVPDQPGTGPLHPPLHQRRSRPADHPRPGDRRERHDRPGVGNADAPNVRTRGRIVKGVVDAAGRRRWSILAETDRMRVTRVVGGFNNPIDAELIGNRLYVLDYAGTQSIWEITLPDR